MASQTAVPGAASVVSRSASPGGGWNGGSPYTALDTVDHIVLSSIDSSNAPWNGTNANWTSGQSDYLYVSGFGFNFTLTDTLVSITANFVVTIGTTGQIYALSIGDTVSTNFDVIQCYNGSTIGSATNHSTSSGTGIGGNTFGVALAATPTIAQINNSNFGLIIGLTGTHTGPGNYSTFNATTAPPIGIDQIQLTIATTPGSSIGGGDNGHGGGPNTPINDKNWQVLPKLGQVRYW